MFPEVCKTLKDLSANATTEKGLLSSGECGRNAKSSTCSALIIGFERILCFLLSFCSIVSVNF